MKNIYNVIIILFSVLCTPSILLSDEIKSELERRYNASIPDSEIYVAAAGAALESIQNKQYDDAFKYAQFSCLQGKLAEGCKILSFCYREGIGTKKDLEKANKLLQNINYKDDDYQKKYIQALQLFENKDYNNAFPLLSDSCINGKYAMACSYLAICYRDGLGVKQDYKKAYDIFSINELINDDYSQINRAQYLEYIAGNDLRNIDEAMKIYNKLINSRNNKISEESKNSLNRIPIYSFYTSLIPPLSHVAKQDIPYNILEKSLLSIDTDGIPSKLRESFLEWRLPFLKIVKYGDEKLINDISKSLKMAIKAIKFNPDALSDAADLTIEESKYRQLAVDQNHYFNMMLELSKSYNISPAFMNFLASQI